LSLDSPPPMHKHPKASAGIQHFDESVHAYVLQRRNVGYAERVASEVASDATSRMPRPLSARSTTIKRAKTSEP
jgi:hypothetical protein